VQADIFTATVDEEADTSPTVAITPDTTPADGEEPYLQPAPNVPPTEPDPIILEIAEVPLAAPIVIQESWSLVNFIFSIATGALAIMMSVRVLLIRKRVNGNMGYVNGRNNRSRLAMMIALPVMAVVGAIISILTQNVNSRMIAADWWTPVHVILFAGSVLCYILLNRGGKDDDTHASASA